MKKELCTALLQNYAKVQEALVIEEIRERGISSIREKGPWQRKRNYMSERQDRTPDTKPLDLDGNQLQRISAKYTIDNFWSCFFTNKTKAIDCCSGECWLRIRR